MWKASRLRLWPVLQGPSRDPQMGSMTTRGNRGQARRLRELQRRVLHQQRVSAHLLRRNLASRRAWQRCLSFLHLCSPLRRLSRHQSASPLLLWPHRHQYNQLSPQAPRLHSLNNSPTQKQTSNQSNVPTNPNNHRIQRSTPSSPRHQAVLRQHRARTRRAHSSLPRCNHNSQATTCR